MKKIFLLLFSLNLLATNLINYNIYQRDNRLDIMLSFDSPYIEKEGDIKILRGPDYVGVILKNINFENKESKILNTPFINQFSIYPHNNDTILEFTTKEKLKIIPALTKNDGFGLRIRVIKEEVKNNDIKFAKEDETLDFRYISVIIIMLILIGILFYVKKRITKTNNTTKNSAANFLNLTKNFTILFERNLDKDNKFVVIQHDSCIYKLIIGNTNIWLNNDNFERTENFDEYFNNNKINLQNTIKQNALNLYKEKIEKI